MDQRVKAKARLATGEIRKISVFALNGMDCSLVKSFSASAIGCGIPIRLTLLGPFRSWE